MAYRTQDLIFTLYGDYLVPHGGEIWTGHIIELMTGLNTSAQAVRSTLSRMTRNGWLRNRREGRHSFYSITPKTEALIAEGTERIYTPRQDPWDGRWYILTYSIPEDQRKIRNRLRQKLTWLGFGHLVSGVWISPRNLRQAVALVAEALGVADQVHFFCGEYFGFSQITELVNKCWNLERLSQAYLEFMAHHQPAWQALAAEAGSNQINPQSAFTRRFLLVHEYRSFPYVDPNLPANLLPQNWPGYDAVHLFQTYAAALAPKANQYVDAVLTAEPGS